MRPSTHFRSAVTVSAMPVPSQSSSGLRVMLVRLMIATTGAAGARPTRGAAPADRVEVAAQLAQRLVPLLAVLGQHPAEDALQLRPSAARARDGRRRLAVEDRVDHLDHVVAGEGERARDQLVEDDAEREDVRAGVEVAPEGLLRRHVGDGAGQAASRGVLRGPAPGVRGVVGAGRILGQPEVQDLHATALRDHHVRGLDVAMHHAAVVGLGQRLRHLPHQGHRLGHIEGMRADELGQGLPGHVLHGDEAAPPVLRLHLVDLVDDRDVRMVQRGGHPRLAQEAAARVLVAPPRSILSATCRCRRRSSAR